MSTNPVGSGPSLQSVAHAPSANTARVARPTGISPGYSQEITRGYLKGTADSSAPIATQIDALRNKLHISPDPRTDSLFRMAVSKLGVRLVGLKGDTAINDRMIDARVAQLEGQRAARNDSFARLKINHDIDQLKTLKELRGLINTGDRLAEERANLSFQMADLNRKLNDPKIPHAERLRVEQEYRSKAEQLDRISIRLKGVPEGMAAEANANVMDAILTKFGNPPKPRDGGLPAPAIKRHAKRVCGILGVRWWCEKRGAIASVHASQFARCVFRSLCKGSYESVRQ